ncbi:MAG: cyclic nucleotide-binding domain-containing protein [bacterium]|nr:cyclic nucleotide-binding domain-containing protein [bacterium]
MKKALDVFDLLRELSADDREELAEFVEERELDEGSLLFQSGQAADEMFFLIDGVLRIESERRVLGHLVAGEVLGAVSLVQISRRECDAVAQQPCRIGSLSRESYLRLRADFPSAALALLEGVLRSLSGHVRTVLADRRDKAATSD